MVVKKSYTGYPPAARSDGFVEKHVMKVEIDIKIEKEGFGPSLLFKGVGQTKQEAFDELNGYLSEVEKEIKEAIKGVKTI